MKRKGEEGCRGVEVDGVEAEAGLADHLERDLDHLRIDLDLLETL